MRKHSKEFFSFCAGHCCRSDGKSRTDYCPIADEVREKYGAIHGGEECREVFVQLKECEV